MPKKNDSMREPSHSRPSQDDSNSVKKARSAIDWSTIVLAVWLFLIVVVVTIVPHKETGKGWGINFAGFLFILSQIGFLWFHYATVRALKPKLLLKLFLFLVWATVAQPLGFTMIGFMHMTGVDQAFHKIIGP